MELHVFFREMDLEERGDMFTGLATSESQEQVGLLRNAECRVEDGTQPQN
jgi:hypothetical protein